MGVEPYRFFTFDPIRNALGRARGDEKEAQQTCNLRARIIGDGNTYELLLDNQYSEDSDLTEITVRGETDEVDEIKFGPHSYLKPDVALVFEGSADIPNVVTTRKAWDLIGRISNGRHEVRGMIVEIVSTVGQETQERPRKSPRFSLKKTSAEGRYDSEYHRDYMQDGLDESNQGDWYPGDKRPPYRTNRARYMNNREYDDNGYDPYYTEHSSHQNGRGHYFQMNLNSIGIDDQSRERNVKRLLIKDPTSKKGIHRYISLECVS